MAQAEPRTEAAPTGAPPDAESDTAEAPAGDVPPSTVPRVAGAAGARDGSRSIGPLTLRRPFYGWWIVAAGSGIQIMFSGLLMQAFGAYAALLRDEFGWSRAMVSGAFSLARAESGVLGPLQGWMLDRFGPPAIMRIGLVIFGVGFMLFSQLNSPVTFYLTFFIIAVGSSLGGPMAITVSIVNWFERRRSTALGISQVGFAIGGLLVPITVLALETWGWRWTAFGSGVLIMAVGIPLSFVIRHRPEPYGYTVDGRPPEPARDTEGTAGAEPLRDPREFTAREAMRTRAFWMVSFGHGSALLVVSAVMVHLVLQLTERLDYSLGQAALVVSLLTATQMAGQVGGASLGDRFEKRVIIVTCMAMHMVGLLLLAFASALWMVVAFAVLHGLAWGTRGPLMMAIRADYFGRTSYGTIMGFSSMIVMLGMMGGPLLAGFLADRTGNYEAGFTVLAIAAGMGSIFFILATRPDPPPRQRSAAPEGAAAPARD